MRKITLLLSMLVLTAMLLAACGGGATSTNVAPTQLPVTSVATEPSTATEMPTEAPVATETAGVPVTGGQTAPAGRMSERLQFQVLDQTGKKVGKVSDLVLNLSKAQVIYVLVNTGGKTVAVPRDMFTVQNATGTGTLMTSTPSAGTGGSGTGSSTSTPSASSSGTDVSTATPIGVATGQAGTGTGSGTESSTATPGTAMDSSTSTPAAGSSSGTGTGTGTGVGSAMGQNAFILLADPTMLQNAPTFDDKNMPALGQSPDSWDIAIRNYWQGGGASSGSNTPSPAGTAVTDMTPTATGGSSSGTDMSTSTPAASSSSGTGIAVTGSAQGATSIQGVALASKVIGAKVTIGMPSISTGTGTSSTPSAGTSSSTSTPSAGGTGSSTATPAASGAGSSTATPATSGAGSSTATPAAGSSSGTGTGSGTGMNANVSGTISDLLVNDSGTILYIVVKTTLSAGESLIPVPLTFLQLDSDNNFVLNLDPATLQSAPTLQSGQFPDMSSSGWDSDFSSFWQNNGGSGSGGVSATATP